MNQDAPGPETASEKQLRQNVEALMALRGMNQTTLAEKLGKSQSWVSEHTRESREMADDLRDALRESAISDKAAALDMGLCPTKLSSQMSGREHLSLWRLASLSPAFQLAFAKRRIQRHGSHLVIERGMLADLIARDSAANPNHRVAGSNSRI